MAGRRFKNENELFENKIAQFTIHVFSLILLGRKKSKTFHENVALASGNSHFIFFGVK